MEGKQISARTARLNGFILGHSVGPLPNSATSSGGITDVQHTEDGSVPLETALSREGLLDSLFVLYEECSKDVIKKKDKNVADFVNKYRPIINQTRTIRVNVNDFNVKNLIGKGYFGEVHVGPYT